MFQIAFAALLAVAVAMPQGQSDVRVVSQRFDMDLAGNYEYSQELTDGQKVSEVGSVQPGSEPETGSITMQGSYEFIGDDGRTYTVTYVADDNGYNPSLDHMPQAPAQLPEYALHRAEFPELYE